MLQMLRNERGFEETRPSIQRRKVDPPRGVDTGENKRQITLRLDSDVLDFFKNTGARYQSRINAVLREYVKAHRNIA